MDPGAQSGYRIVRSQPQRHVTDVVVNKLEDEVSAATGWKVEPPYGKLLQKAARLCATTSTPFPLRKGGGLFMVMMGAHRIPLNAADWLATRGRRVAWLFDAWPSSYRDLATLARRYRIDLLLITAKQSADRMAREIESCEVKWCAEPFVDLGFKSKLWIERAVDVIQFGRKYEPYHARLVRDLSGMGRRYVFEERAGQVVFPTTTEFVRGLADSRISVCFPCDMTHPERAGDVSTVTQRYFQSFASGCVVVGESPQELIQLFGYDPVVKADLENPATQVAEILADLSRYASLVERNLEEVKRHTTVERVEAILREMA